MADKIYQLLYASQETAPLSDVDCESILKVSRENNARDDITGFLAYLPNGVILQILEGAKSAVQQKYRHITKDKRHARVTTVFENTCDERQFYGWSMGFRKLSQSEADTIPGFIDLRDGKTLANVGDGPTVIKLLKAIFAASAVGKK